MSYDYDPDWHRVDAFQGQDVGPDEGWYLYNRTEIMNNPGGFPNPYGFRTSDEAVTFVKQRADEGSDFHKAAIAQHIKARLLG